MSKIDHMQVTKCDRTEVGTVLTQPHPATVRADVLVWRAFGSTTKKSYDSALLVPAGCNSEAVHKRDLEISNWPPLERGPPTRVLPLTSHPNWRVAAPS